MGAQTEKNNFKAGTRNFCSAVTDLVRPIQIFFSSPYTILWLYRPASWAGSRAGLPVSYYVCLSAILERRPKQNRKLKYAIQTCVQCMFNLTATKIPCVYSFSENCAASVPISTCMCLWPIYILGSVYIFGCNKIDKPILEIYKSLTDMSVGIGRENIIILFRK